MNEDERQIVHLLLSFLVIALTLAVGVELAAYVVSVVLILGLVLVHLKLTGAHLGPLERFLEKFERAGSVPGYGALTYAAGMLAILTLLSSEQQILASIAILGVGDAASTIAGLRSRKKLSYNRKKTWGGSCAFFLCASPFAFLFAGLPGILVAAIAAAAESLEARVDDNLIVAVACVVAFRLIGA
jgi:dolichol kinase